MPPWASQHSYSSAKFPAKPWPPVKRKSHLQRQAADRSFLWDPKQVKGAWEGSLETDRERAERSGAETGLRSPAKEAEGSPLFCNF